MDSLFISNKCLTSFFFFFLFPIFFSTLKKRVDPTEHFTSTHEPGLCFWRICISLNTHFWAQCRRICTWCQGLCYSGNQMGRSNGPFRTADLWIGRVNEFWSRERLLWFRSFKLSSHWGNKQMCKIKNSVRHHQIVDLFWQMHFSVNSGPFKHCWQMSLKIICKN